MPNIGTLSIQIIAEATQFDRQIRNALKGVESFKQTASGLYVPASAVAASTEKIADSMEAAGQAAGGLGAKLENTAPKATSLWASLSQLNTQLGLMFSGMSFAATFTAPFMVAAGTAINSSVKFSDAFTGIRKTVDATATEFEQLENNIRQMSTEMPVAAEDLAHIGQLAGQLGIRGVGNLTEFIDTVARLGVSTNLSTEEGAQALARFANIVSMPLSQVNQLGSTIVDLGNKTATTEKEIMDFALRIAGAGHYVGLTEAQILGFGATLSAVGINAEAGGTAVSRVFIELAKAVTNGGQELSLFAKVAGMSGAQFRKAFQQDAATATATFISGLGQLQKEGHNVFAILDVLGLNEIRVRDALLRTAAAGDLLNKTLNIANQAWAKNNALLEESNKFFAAPGNRIKVLVNNALELARVFGDTLAPVLLGMVQVATQVLRILQHLPSPIQYLLFVLGGLLALIGPTMLFLSNLGLMARGVAISMELLGGAAIGARLIPAIKNLGKVLLWLTKTPAGLITSIAALIISSIVLEKGWAGLVSYAKKAWAAIGAAVLYGASLVVRGVGLILAVIGAIIPPVRGAAQAVLELADSLKTAAKHSWAATKEAVPSKAAWDFLKGSNEIAKNNNEIVKSQQNIAKTGKQAAKSQDNLAKSTKKAAESAENNLQSFDEVHLIQKEIAEGPAGISAPKVSAPELGIEPTSVSAPKISAPGIDIGEPIRQANQAIDDAVSAWDRLKNAMEPVNRAVQWIKNNWPTIGPIVEGIAGVITLLLVPAMIKSGIEALKAGGKILLAWTLQGVGAVKTAALTIWSAAVIVGRWIWMGIQSLANAGKVVLAWGLQGIGAAGAVAATIGSAAVIVGRWIWMGIQSLANAGKVVLAWGLQGIGAAGAVAATIGSAAVIVGRWVWMGVQSLVNAGKMALAWVIALGPVGWVIATVIAVAALVIAKWDWIKKKTGEIWGVVKEWLATKWGGIKEKAATIWGWIKDKIITPIRDAWTWLKTTWGTIKKQLGTTWDGIKTKADTVWGAIKGAIKGAINGIIRAINWMIRGLNKLKITIPDWLSYVPGVEGLAGKTFGFNIKEIPLLASGGIVTGPAIVGEAGPELVMPLSRDNVLVDGIAKAVYRAVVDGIRVTQVAQQPTTQEVVLRIDGTTFARLILPAIIKEGQRQGLQLVVRPQGA